MEIVETFLALSECLGRDVDFQSREQLRRPRSSRARHAPGTSSSLISISSNIHVCRRYAIILNLY